MPSFMANGSIAPSRFCKLDTTAEGKILQCGAGDKVIGISDRYTRRAPLDGWDDGFAAKAGEMLHVFGEFDCDYCWLETGAAVTRDDLLKADTNGKGISTTTENDELGAIALESAGGAGILIKVRPKQRQNV